MRMLRKIARAVFLGVIVAGTWAIAVVAAVIAALALLGYPLR